MLAFAELVDKLYFTSSNLAKAALIRDYLKNTPDPDRGWAIAAIAGTLNFEFFKRKTIKDLIIKRVDPVLFALSYDYVGEMSETVAHLWHALPNEAAQAHQPLPSLATVVNTFKSLPKKEIEGYLITLLNQMNATQRWALIKLGTGGLRIGVSARFLKKILAEYGQSKHVCTQTGDSNAPSSSKADIASSSKEGVDYINATTAIEGSSTLDAIGAADMLKEETDALSGCSVEEVERLWHGVTPPYTNLLAWLEGKGDKPDVSKSVTFQPVMLSHPLAQEDLNKLVANEWVAEWKFDGIRVQLVISEHGKALFSRTGDDISHSFPDVLEGLNASAYTGVFDGELLAIEALCDQQQAATQGARSGVKDSYKVASFNQLQQRLNKKKPSKKLMQQNPAGIMLYDCLRIANTEMRSLSLTQRQRHLSQWYDQFLPPRLMRSNVFEFSHVDELIRLRKQATADPSGYIEGLMIKHKASKYSAGRPKNKWFKWKRDPMLIDAVMMYAQRGHGKRSSFYSDYTFGCWQEDKLLPVGKAYSGFTDVELKQIDKWIRGNTIGRFGPVKEVKKELVFELAFDSVHLSNRHKSGIALRFPRVHRIRWDKPASEADNVESLLALSK